MTAATPRLGKRAQDLAVQRLVEKLGAGKFFPEHAASFPAEQFHAFRNLVRQHFFVPETSITPIMARLYFALSASRKPERIVGIGTYAGNALAWLAGPVLGSSPLYTSKQIVGCDIDREATELARRNFAKLPGGERVDLVCADGHQWLEENEDPIDLLYLDIDSPGERKIGYTTLLKKALARLSEGALVVAHDVCEPKFTADFEPYFEMVKDPALFQRSATLHIDPCGVEVSLK